MTSKSSRSRLALFFGSVSILLMMMLSFKVWAAYCSLRDPVMAIRTLYPQSGQHRSIVKTITGEARTHIAQRLPFTLHFNEIGRHTLYVAKQENTPVGFVHARSELSEWGVIEIAWAITPDFRIHDFYFQRCRSPACSEELRVQLLADIKDKSVDQLLLMLSADGKSLAPILSDKYRSNTDLVLSLVRSSLKTIAATEFGWSEEVRSARRLNVVIKNLPNIAVPRLEPLKADQKVVQRIPKALAPIYNYIDQSSIQVFRVLDETREVARLVEAKWLIKDQTGEFSWLFNSAGEVVSIIHYDPMPSDDVSQSFSELLGRNLSSMENCATAAEISGGTLFLNAYKNIEVF